MSKKNNYRYNHNLDYETYETKHEWITPIGEYNIVHLDCPTPDEIKQRVTEFINEIIEGKEADEICPPSTGMGGLPYNTTYYCQMFCHECKKAVRCKNFKPDSKEEEERMNRLVDGWIKEDETS